MKVISRVLAVVMVLLATGCSASGDEGLPDVVARVSSGDELLWTKGGREVSKDEVGLSAGPEHCFKNTLTLNVGWPPGTQAKTLTDRRWFTRDPDGQSGVPQSGVPLGPSLGVA